MLVLSRKPGERIVIGGGIEVVVLDTRRGQVRLGFIAPDDVRISRQEVLCRAQQPDDCSLSQQRLANVLRTAGHNEAMASAPHILTEEAATA